MYFSLLIYFSFLKCLFGNKWVIVIWGLVALVFICYTCSSSQGCSAELVFCSPYSYSFDLLLDYMITGYWVTKGREKKICLYIKLSQLAGVGSTKKFRFSVWIILHLKLEWYDWLLNDLICRCSWCPVRSLAANYTVEQYHKLTWECPHSQLGRLFPFCCICQGGLGKYITKFKMWKIHNIRSQVQTLNTRYPDSSFHFLIFTILIKWVDKISETPPSSTPP